MKKFTLITSLVIFSICAARATEPTLLEQKRHVTVQGQGKVQAVPDIAIIIAGVSQEGPSLDTVSTQVRETAAKIIAAIKKENIAEKDIQTYSYSVQPKYSYEKTGTRKRTGYVVANSLQVRVHDVKKVGKILGAVVDAGATSVDGPNFDFEKPQELERQALTAAMEDATAKARVLAEAGKSSLGPVLTVDQNGGAVPYSRFAHAAMSMKAMAAAAPEPVETGEQSFTANITATFALQ